MPLMTYEESVYTTRSPAGSSSVTLSPITIMAPHPPGPGFPLLAPSQKITILPPVCMPCSITQKKYYPSRIRREKAMKTKKKGVIRNRMKVALLREIADIAWILKTSGIPQKKLSYLDRAHRGNDADIRLQDIHARIGSLIRAARRGKLIGTAYDVGIMRGITLGYDFAQKELSEKSKGGTVVTAVL